MEIHIVGRTHEIGRRLSFPMGWVQLTAELEDRLIEIVHTSCHVRFWPECFDHLIA
jgi:hypothetical protein